MRKFALFMTLLGLVGCIVTTYSNPGGTCRWTLDCPGLTLGDNGGSLWPYAPGATTGTFSDGWVQWSLVPYPGPYNTCTNFQGTSTYPQLPRPWMQGTVYTFTLTGVCSGVDSDGKPYLLATTQNLETYYSRGGGGKGGGGAGWRVRDTGGATRIGYQ